MKTFKFLSGLCIALTFLMSCTADPITEDIETVSNSLEMPHINVVQDAFAKASSRDSGQIVAESVKNETLKNTSRTEDDDDKPAGKNKIVSVQELLPTEIFNKTEDDDDKPKG